MGTTYTVSSYLLFFLVCTIGCVLLMLLLTFLFGQSFPKSKAPYFPSCRGFIGKQLVIVFNDGKSYYFDMDHYLGVQNVYNAIQNNISKGA